MEHKVVANRKVKDTVFHRLFSEDKENALSLYNALNGTNYTDTDELTYTTLEEAVFLSYKEDCAFVVSRSLNLYEHQSTINPNMPLRGLLYFTRMYQDLINPQSKLYGKSLLRIPNPKYVVFYNGSDNQEDIIKLKLSDMFMEEDCSGEFEWTATMININEGHNEEIKRRCEVLREYAIFIGEVKNQSLKYDFNIAVQKAVDTCINEGVLSDFLRKIKSEVMMDILTEFDEEEYREMIREEGIEQGIEQGQRLIIVRLLKEKKISLSDAADALGVSPEELQSSL